MFSFRGVVLLLRTKGNGFIVGLWTELCTLFIVAALWMVDDDQRRPAVQRLPRALLGTSVLLTCFVAGFGFWLYVLARVLQSRVTGATGAGAAAARDTKTSKKASLKVA